MKREHQYLIGGAAAVALLVGTAVGASYLTRESLDNKPVVQQARTTQVQPTRYSSMEPAAGTAQQPPCDDNNIVGTLGGGAAGGLVGSRFGSGNGQTAATVVGALGGAALGNKYIPTRGATCN